MWKTLAGVGTIAAIVGALIFFVSMLSLSMFFPFRGRQLPKLLPLLPLVKDQEKAPLPIKIFGPGLWATGGMPDDKFKRENGVEHVKHPNTDKE